MSTNSLRTIEIDAIGEILNISLGASATAVSTMLDTRVDITTPNVSLLSKEEFEFSELEPAIGVEITYVSGLSGSNMMLLKREDVRIIVGMLMGATIPEEDFEMNEMNVSAICEVMNQMMGASSTALSELFGKAVNISTPSSFEVNDLNEFRDRYYGDNEKMVVVRFILKIEDKVESEFLNMMSVPLAKEMVSGFFPDGVPNIDDEEEAKEEVEEVVKEKEHEKQEQIVTEQKLEEPEIKEPLDKEVFVKHEETAATTEQAPFAEVEHISYQQPMVENKYAMEEQNFAKEMMTAMQQQQQQFMEQMQQMQMMMQTSMQNMMQATLQNQPAKQPPEQKQIKVQKMVSPTLTSGTQSEHLADGEDVNMDLIMGVPLDISVEIGRTKKLVKDILEFNKGTLVVLDKAAGEQVDLFVNGQCIAKGDVVVIDDNFGIRITEILKESIKF